MQSSTTNQAIVILKQLRQAADEEAKISDRLSRIMKIIAEQMGYDGVSCFVAIDDSYLELFAEYGFNPDAMHKVSLRFGEGLIGSVAKNGRPLALSDAKNHPKYVIKEKLGEEGYNSFLGVPLMRRHRAIGVLVAETKSAHEFSRQEQETLETIAMFLSDVVSSDEMTEYKNNLIKSRGIVTKERIKGLSLSKGYGIGRAVLHRRRHAVTKIFSEDKDKSGAPANE